MPKKAKDKYSYPKVTSQFRDLENEQSDWKAEWQQISNYLLPGRGIYQGFSKPQKRKLTSHQVINPIAEDALYVLTSGMHGGLTSPSMPWFDLAWADDNLDMVEPLKAWLEECTIRIHAGLHKSNFYSIINSFYIEYAGFGTGCIYLGEDTGTDSAPFRFELLTAGEYVFSIGADGKPAVFMRPIFMSPRQMVAKFPDTVSTEMKKSVENNQAGSDTINFSILECIYRESYQDKAYTQYIYEVQSIGTQGTENVNSQTPLKIAGFYEFPYPFARWGTIGSDIYGVGPGSRALSDIRRLQEMEKAFLMATHKTINPPLNAPARMRGKLNTLPGGYNYYANPNEMVKEMYQIKFDFQGISVAVERIEERIRRNFFNDIFLVASRDPNASPLKATQVRVQEQEKMLRLGPVIERLQFEFLSPIVERAFNIMLRKGELPELSPELQQLVGSYTITLISPLAAAQKAVALQGINSFMGFLGNAAQFDQTILDNVDADEAAREYADVSGVRLGILRTRDQVEKIRKDRAAAQAAEKKRQEEIALAGAKAELDQKAADTRLANSEAGLNMAEGQQVAAQMGIG